MSEHMSTLVKITSDGIVNYSRRLRVRGLFSPKMETYPYDIQFPDFLFASTDYSTRKVLVRFYSSSL